MVSFCPFKFLKVDLFDKYVLFLKVSSLVP